MQRQLNFKETQERAKAMTWDQLMFARHDCMAAAKAAQEIEAAGHKVDKDSGYYYDESGVYAAEMRDRRRNAEARNNG